MSYIEFYVLTMIINVFYLFSAQRYCPMLQAEEGSEILNDMCQSQTLDVRVTRIAFEIKKLLE